MNKVTERDTYTAGLIIIGNEVLVGRTQDANTPWIAQRLTERGIMLAEVRIVPDDEEVIIRTVNEIRTQYDYIFTTGGIGPTHDDITAQSIAKAFHVALELNPEACAILEEHYGLENFTDARKRMARIPHGATLIPNAVSAAPGFVIENVYVMAGVPRIMQAMLDHILTTIKAGKPILSNTVVCQLMESTVAIELEAIQSRYPTLQIGSYPHSRGGMIGLSLVLRGTDKPLLNEATEVVIKMIKTLGDEPRALSMREDIEDVKLQD